MDTVLKVIEDDQRVGHVHRVIHTKVKFQRITKVFKLGNWTLIEVENEDGSKEMVGEHQVLQEVDVVCGV